MVRDRSGEGAGDDASGSRTRDGAGVSGSAGSPKKDSKAAAVHVLSTYEAMIATVNEMRRKKKEASASVQEAKGVCLCM